MIEPGTLHDPELRLALAYAPAARRQALHTVFAIDQRLAEIAAATREPGIGLIKLAWWRDALGRLDHLAVPAEPLLVAVAATLLPLGLSGTALSDLEEGWSALIGGDADDPDQLLDHARRRGSVLFGLAARTLGGDGADLQAAGTLWALVDRARTTPRVGLQRALLDRARSLTGSLPRRWERPVRPLGVLAVLAARDARASVPEARGSPRRLLRALRLGLTGT